MSVLYPNSLPSYSPSPPAPLYSLELRPDEQRLESTPRRAPHPTPTGTYVKSSRHASVILEDQEEGTEVPSYGRNAFITGQICLQKCETVNEVVLKLEGRLDLMISEGGSTSSQLFQDCYTIWSGRSALGNSCPEVLPFTCRFPSTFQDGEQNRPLPPSYDIGFPGVPGLFVKSVYILSIIIKRRGARMSLWPNSKTINIKLRYFPRTRPGRQILPNSCFFSTLKPSPEEWHQVLSTMKTRKDSGLQPIQCHLFVPSVQIFGLSDTIPFHVQLNGPIASLREFVRPQDSEATPSTSKKNIVHPKPSIRVFLLRQIAVEVRGQRAWRNSTLGEGKLSPLPPSMTSSVSSLPEDSQDSSLDWEGEVRCNNDVTVGGFNAGKVIVKDFIVLTLKAPIPELSPLLELQSAHPIRLVTDTWIDYVGPGIGERV